MKKIIAAAILSLSVTSAHAHSDVNTTEPANGAVLNKLPANLDLTFADKIRITKIEVSHGPHVNMALDLGDQTSFTKQITIPAHDMGTSTYTINWRGLGADGHAMTGEFMFEVK
jgi:methionine-rich copper-binding protein CopC